MGAVAIWLLQVVPIYTATTQILIDHARTARTSNTEPDWMQPGLDGNRIATELSLIQSFTIARRVVERLKLEGHPRFGEMQPEFSLFAWLANSATALVSTPPSDPRPNTAAANPVEISPAALAAIGRVQAGVAVRRVEFSNFIDISYVHSDPETAATLANAIAEAYLVEQLEARYQAAKRTAGWMSERVASLRSQLEVSEQALAEHRAKYNIDISVTGTLSEQKAAEINGQLVTARAQAIEKKAKYDHAQKMLEGGDGIESIAAAMESPAIGGLRQQEAVIARNEAELLTRHGSEHPEIVKVRAERADIKRQISREVGRMVQSLKADYESALKKGQALEAGLRDLWGGGNRNDHVAIRGRELERDVQANRVLYETLLARLTEAEQQTTLPTTESRVIAPALVPGRPSYPDMQRLLLLAIAGGLALGMGAAVLLESIENGFTTMEEIEQALQLPVLALVPQVLERERKIDDEAVPIPDYVAVNPLSRVGESIRSVRVSTQMSDIDRPPRLILVTSSVPSEGKTTVALSLAYSAAAANQRVLLMDCDLRHPSASKHFNLHNGPGLTDLLLGQASPERVFACGSLPTLTFLPAGTATRHPPDILGSERLQHLFEKLRETYDVIYIDAPPVTPVIDSVILSKLMDKVVFVVQWRTTPRDIVHRALHVLDEARQKVAGIVLNNAQLGLLASYAPYYSYYHKKYRKYYAQ